MKERQHQSMIVMIRGLDGRLTKGGIEYIEKHKIEEDNEKYKNLIDTYVMTIQEKINADLKQSILNNDVSKKNLLRVVIGEFNRVDKIVSDEKAFSILKKMYENALDQMNETEGVILLEYLPRQLSSQDLNVVILQIIATYSHPSPKIMGKIMADLKKEYRGQYDGKVAGDLVKTALNSLPTL